MSTIRTEQVDLLGHGWWDVRSEDDVYRYEVGHRFDTGPVVGFVGINPSTAVAGKPDATTRKWTGFAKRWGFGGWVAVNPFAYRSTDVTRLMSARDPIGPRNDELIREAFGPVTEIVVCWGNPPSVKLMPRLVALTKVLGAFGKPLRCVGRTTLGNPRHLLMEPYSSQREAFAP